MLKIKNHTQIEKQITKTKRKWLISRLLSLAGGLGLFNTTLFAIKNTKRFTIWIAVMITIFIHVLILHWYGKTQKRELAELEEELVKAKYGEHSPEYKEFCLIKDQIENHLKTSTKHRLSVRRVLFFLITGIGILFIENIAIVFYEATKNIPTLILFNVILGVWVLLIWWVCLNDRKLRELNKDKALFLN